MSSQGFTSSHFTDDWGNPAGGATYGTGFAIAWQNGPLVEGGTQRAPNGAFVEDIIEAAMNRLAFYQTTRFANDYNHRALVALREACRHLNDRTADRESRGVEGTHQE